MYQKVESNWGVTASKQCQAPSSRPQNDKRQQPPQGVLPNCQCMGGPYHYCFAGTLISSLILLFIFWAPMQNNIYWTGHCVTNHAKLHEISFFQIYGPQILNFCLVVIQGPQILIERKILEPEYTVLAWTSSYFESQVVPPPCKETCVCWGSFQILWGWVTNYYEAETKCYLKISFNCKCSNFIIVFTLSWKKILLSLIIPYKEIEMVCTYALIHWRVCDETRIWCNNLV